MQDIRQNNDIRSAKKQNIHQWLDGRTRHMLTYQAERLAMSAVLQEERYTGTTSPACGQRGKSAVQGQLFQCPRCQWVCHRNSGGSTNIWATYQGVLRRCSAGVLGSSAGARRALTGPIYSRGCSKQVRACLLVQKRRQAAVDSNPRSAMPGESPSSSGDSTRMLPSR